MDGTALCPVSADAATHADSTDSEIEEFWRGNFSKAVPRLMHGGTVGPRLCSLVSWWHECMARRPNGGPAAPRDGGTVGVVMAGALCIVCVLQGHANRDVLTAVALGGYRVSRVDHSL